MKFDNYGFKSNLPANYKSKVAIWGTASTGDPHLGYAVYMLMLKRLQKEGTIPTVLIAEHHAYWDAQKTSLDMIESRAKVYHHWFKNTGLVVKKTQEFYKQPEYLQLLFELSEKMSVSKLLEAGKLSLVRCEKPLASDQLKADKATLADILRVAAPILSPDKAIQTFYEEPEHITRLFELSEKISVNKLLTIQYAGTSIASLDEVLTEEINEPTLADAISVATQLIDPLYLKADVVLCGPREALIHKYGFPLLKREKNYSPYHVWTTLLPGLNMEEMHASDPQTNKVLLSDTDEIISEKLQSYISRCNSSSTIPPLALYCQKTLFPLADLSETAEALGDAVQRLDYSQIHALLTSGIIFTIRRAAFSYELSSSLSSEKRTSLPFTNDLSIKHTLSACVLSFPPGYRRETPIKCPIFVLGSPRSGTTVIASCLINHPDLQGYPKAESLFLLDEYRKYADLHQGNNRRGWKPLQSYMTEVELLDAIGAFSDAVLKKSHSNDKRYVDHTPWYAAIIPFINALYPDSIFVHVVRNGIDVVGSLGVSYKKGFTWVGNNIADRTKLWSSLVKSALESKNLVGEARYIQVSYEDFCSNPQDTLSKILNKLGLEWNATCLEPTTIAHVDPGRGNAAVLGERDKDDNIIIKQTSRLPSYSTESWSYEDLLVFKEHAEEAMRGAAYENQLKELDALIQNKMGGEDVEITIEKNQPSFTLF